MDSTLDGRARLDADLWRRIGAVLDRVSGLDPRRRRDALEEACLAEGVSVEVVRPYLDAQERLGTLPETLDPEMLLDAWHALAGDDESATLAPGIRLGPYEILSLLGVGGMGEVYRARDTRLDRDVVLKRLKAHVAEGPDGDQRLEREALAISALNHPHICTLHDVGRHEGVQFLVMELVEGETLAARLRRGPLPLQEALRYAAQMADALAAAHRQGVVHRDLKPDNVMLTPHGVKLLDFGVAALRFPQEAVEDADNQARPAGTILGTPQYMAPEQLGGQPVDGRADVFSLGAILYEMLTGRRAFGSDHAAAEGGGPEPHPRPLGLVRPDVPPALDWVVAQCLIALPEQRWQNAADLARQLRWIETAPPVVVPPPRRSAIGYVTAVAAALALAVAAIGYLLERRSPDTPPSYRLEIPFPPDTSGEPLFAVSPNGRQLAFAATDTSGVRALWIRYFERSAALRIEHTEGALDPFWSPDGESIGFFADGKLKIVDLSARTVRILADAGRGGGATWNADGVVLFADESTATTASSPLGLRHVSASGGAAKSLPPVMPPQQEGRTIQRYPRFFPDGRHYLYTQLRPGAAGVYVGRLGGGTPTLVLPAMVTEVTPQQLSVMGPLRAIYAEGYLFYLDSRDRALLAQPFDVTHLRLTGEPVRIADEVESSAGRSAFDVSASGVLVYRMAPATGVDVSQIPWFDGPAPDIMPLGPAAPAAQPMIVLTYWPSLVKR